MKVCLIVPMTSRKRDFKDVKDTPVYNILYPSLIETIESEKEKYEYTLYLGIDDDDEYFLQNRERIVEELSTDYLKVEIHDFSNTQHCPVWVWNKLFDVAYADGNDYFYQVGDDIRLIDKGWTTKFIENIQRFQGLGSTGPLDVNNTNLLTQSFVGRLHHEIFGYYFPYEFKNWFCDNWMHMTYQNINRLNWDHSIKVRNSGGAERYNIDFQIQSQLKEIVVRDINKIVDFTKKANEQK